MEYAYRDDEEQNREGVETVKPTHIIPAMIGFDKFKNGVQTFERELEDLPVEVKELNHNGSFYGWYFEKGVKVTVKTSHSLVKKARVCPTCNIIYTDNGAYKCLHCRRDDWSQSSPQCRGEYPS